MKFKLDDNNKVISYTNDPLATDFQVEDVAPEGDPLSYRYIAGVFVLVDAPAPADGPAPVDEPATADEPAPVEKRITFTAVTGKGVKTHTEDFSVVSLYELENAVITGTLAIPDDTFEVPATRDDGRTIIFDATVVDGVFTIPVNFPTSGTYMYTDKEANTDLPEGTFSVSPMKIKVIRRVLPEVTSEPETPA